jgi:hypothetical protein
VKYYRYRTLKQAEEIVAKKELYFANPKQFNDPFEFEFLTIYEAPVEVKRRYFENDKEFDFKNAFASASEETVNEFLTNDAGLTYAEKIRNKFRDRFLDQVGVLCLAESPTNIGLWAHYGDNHRGICFEFDFHHENFGEAFKVEYCRDVPNFNHFEEFEGKPEYMVRKIISTKSICWEHEQEHRFILNRSGVVKFHANSLKAAYLGMKIDRSSDVFKLLAIHTPDLPLYFLGPASGEYSFDIINTEPILAKNFI